MKHIDPDGIGERLAARHERWKRLNARRRAAQLALHKGIFHPRAEAAPPAATVAALMAAIPDDTRSLTGRVLGDPLPGDRRRG